MEKVQHVGIVGGGLVGLTLAAGLAREGVKVTIFEKRKEVVSSKGRQTQLYLNYKGVKALNDLGIKC